MGKDNGSDTGAAWRNAGQAFMLPTMIGACAVIGVVMGHYLDRWLGTRPWFTLILLIGGFVSGVRETMKVVRRMNRDNK